MPDNSHLYHISRILLLLSALFLIGCAPTIKRSGYFIEDEYNRNENCSLKITYNEPERSKADLLGSAHIYDNGFSMGCSEEEIIALIREEGCQLRATQANLYSIKPPSFWGSSCFQTRVAFYKSVEPQIVKEEKTVTLQTASSQKRIYSNKDAHSLNSDYQKETNKVEINSSKSNCYKKKYTPPTNNGTRLKLLFRNQPVVAGEQNKFGDDLPIEPNLSKVQLGLALQYAPIPNIGGVIRGAIGGTIAEFAADPQKGLYTPESYRLFDETVIHGGIIWYPLIITKKDYLINLSLEGGVGHTSLSFADDEIKELFIDKKASGLGGYWNLGGEWVFSKGFLFGFVAGYEWSSPKFEGATKALDAGAINLQWSIGYKFKG